LGHALEVEAFIASCHVDCAAGSTWSRLPDELHRATGEPRSLDIAVAGGDELVAALDGEVLSVAIYSGIPGYKFLLDELAAASAAVSRRGGRSGDW
jgi:hypothetical protein